MTTALPFQTQQPIFGKVGGIAELVHMSEEDRLKYNISLDTYRTNLSVMKNERAEGRQEGLIDGHKKGLAEANLAFATKMKMDGMPTNIIQKYTGLSVKEIVVLIHCFRRYDLR